MSIRIMSESEYAQQRRAETMTATEREIIEKTDQSEGWIDSVNAEVMASILSSTPAGLNGCVMVFDEVDHHCPGRGVAR